MPPDLPPLRDLPRIFHTVRTTQHSNQRHLWQGQCTWIACQRRGVNDLSRPIGAPICKQEHIDRAGCGPPFDTSVRQIKGGIP